jgi:hypothetical protein
MREKLTAFRKCFLYPPPSFLSELVVPGASAEAAEQAEVKVARGAWWYTDQGREEKCGTNMFQTTYV